jgi:hypothetical protein
LAHNVTASWAETDREKGDLNGVKHRCTSAMLFDIVRVESSFAIVTAKPDCFVTQPYTVFG